MSAWSTPADSQAPFRAFSVFHLTFLLGAPIAAYVLSEVGRRRVRAREWLRLGLALALMCIGASWYFVRLFIWHERWQDALPLEMCDASLWLSVAALLWNNQAVREITFYWAVSGGVMALLTPDVQDPEWSVRTLSFLFGHAGLVIAGVFLVRACRTELRASSWWRALLALNIYAAVVGLLDVVLQTDYMFLCTRPAVASPLDFMGPWPYYIISADLLAAAMFYAMYRITRPKAAPNYSA